jgi:hypothetical protein
MVMSNQLNSFHLACEADRVDAHDRTMAIPGFVSRDERVLRRPPEDYKVPSFIRSTAPNLYAELEEILGKLCEYNESHVGERAKEVEACLVLSGLADRLSDQIKAWCEMYFSQRAQKINPRDDGDPFHTFLRLLGEFDKLFACRNTPNSTDYIFFGSCVPYVRWLICELTLKDRMALRKNEEDGRWEIAFSWHVQPSTVRHIMCYLPALGVLENNFPESLHNVYTAVDAGWLERESRTTATDIWLPSTNHQPFGSGYLRSGRGHDGRHPANAAVSSPKLPRGQGHCESV